MYDKSYHNSSGYSCYSFKQLFGVLKNWNTLLPYHFSSQINILPTNTLFFFTFLKCAFPAPERIASIKACLEFPGLSVILGREWAFFILNCAADNGKGGGGGGRYCCTFAELLLFFKTSSAFRNLCNSSEANEEIYQLENLKKKMFTEEIFK